MTTLNTILKQNIQNINQREHITLPDNSRELAQTLAYTAETDDNLDTIANTLYTQHKLEDPTWCREHATPDALQHATEEHNLQPEEIAATIDHLAKHGLADRHTKGEFTFIHEHGDCFAETIDNTAVHTSLTKYYQDDITHLTSLLVDTIALIACCNIAGETTEVDEYQFWETYQDYFEPDFTVDGIFHSMDAFWKQYGDDVTE